MLVWSLRVGEALRNGGKLGRFMVGNGRAYGHCEDS